jgi:hypothetical protein
VKSSWIVPALGGLLGGVFMTVALGPAIVDPTQFEWLMHGDYALHFLGWHLYRHGPWSWPIGATPLLIAPIGSSIGLTDSIPLASIPLKLLDPVLPPIFQFIGAWLVLSVALQGVFGVLLMRVVTPRPSLQLIGAALLVLSPPLIFRINHAALTAHWDVLAALWLSFRPDADVVSWRRATAWALLCAATAATQPYLLVMIVVLMLAAHARQLLVAPGRVLWIALHAAIATSASVIALWQSGSLMIRANEGLDVGGFDAWTSNLLTFIMPTEAWTLFHPGVFPYHHKDQYEGYAYLGAGMLLLGAAVIVAGIARLRFLRWPPSAWRYLPLALALIFLTLMALGPTITAGPYVLLKYDSRWWGPLSVFRASGRMIWPLFYATAVAILFGASRWPYRRALVVCTLALVVQAIDMAGMVRYLRDIRAFGFRDPLVNPFWTIVPPYYDGLVLIPPSLCTPENYVEATPFSLRAGTSGIGINTGVTARYDVRRAREYCAALMQETRTGIRPDRSLYVLRLDLVPQLVGQSADPPLCTAIDGYGVCFSAESHARWRQAFDVPRSRLPEMSEFLRFYQDLDEMYRSTLGRTPHDAPGTPAARIEGIAGYLSLRMEGCDHDDAQSRMVRRLEGTDDRAWCPRPSLHHQLPPADQTLAFSTRFLDALRNQTQPGVTKTHVDPEGEAVWLQAYARERASGAREPDAKTTVLAAIRATSK